MAVSFQSGPSTYGKPVTHPAFSGFVGEQISKVMHKAIPDYHLPASPDITALTRDSFNNPWKPDDVFNPKLAGDILNVRQNLQNNLESLPPAELLRIALMALPLADYPENKLAELERTRQLPSDPKELDALKTAILDRQFQALKDITIHALNAERLSVRPLSLAIFKMPRRPDIQLLNGTFTTDEGKHSATFERYLTEFLGGKQRDISIMDWAQSKAFDVTAICMPSTALFLALMIETVGGSFFEFFSQKSPDPLFRRMCDTIANKDEKRHMKICSTVFNNLYRGKITDERLEKLNAAAMKWLPKILYGEHTQPGHPLIQACQAFGVPPMELVNHITRRIREEFAEIDFNLDFSDYPLALAESSGNQVPAKPAKTKLTFLTPPPHTGLAPA